VSADALRPWPRAWLFTPADDERKLASAPACGADAVILDLEDAVAPSRKDLARVQAIELLRDRATPAAGGAAPLSTLVLRINDPREQHGGRDLDALCELGVGESVVAMVPKATVETVACTRASGARVVALIETPQGLAQVEEIAAAEGVLALAIGTVDLAAALGLGELPDGLELLYARSRIVLAGALAGIPALDGVHLNTQDSSALRREAERARALGFAGKLCIHPRQLAVVREAFTPSAQELQGARRLLADYERMLAEGRGVGTAGEEMIDVATVRRARRTLDAAQAGDRGRLGG
jgi:citrate lyase subunit beta/citryl-CoA lyase